MKIRPLLATALLATSAAAQAASYAISYQGTIGPPVTDTSAIAGIAPGAGYTLSFILDNGGASASGQGWQAGDITCIVLRTGGARLAVDTSVFGANSVSGHVETDPAGTLSHVFGHIDRGPIPPSEYTATGLALQPDLRLWVRPHDNSALLLRDGDASAAAPHRTATDAAGGLDMNAGRWSSPYAVNGPCDETPTAPLPQPPNPPEGVSAQPGNRSVVLSWTTPATGTPPASYTAYAMGISTSPSCTVAHPATSCTVAGLANGHPYTFAVTAMAPGAHPSAPSATVTATPFAPGAPGAPTSVTGTPGDGQVTLRWQPPAAGGAPVSYSAVANNGNSCTVPAPVTTCTVRGLTNGTPYAFIVGAANAAGITHASSVSFTPMAGPSGGVQPVPALGLPALALLGLGAAAVGARRLRRNNF